MNERPMRVLLIAPSLHILGGQAVQAQRLLHWLGGQPGLEIDFQPINPKLPGRFARLQDIKFVRTLITIVLYWTMLAARVWRYDLLHVFTASYWSYTLWSLPALLFAKLYGKKIVLNYRDGQCEDHLANWRSALPTIRRMDLVVSPSGYLVEVFARYGISARHVSNVIDMDPFHYRERPHPRPVLLHNRILEPLYNIQCTLRAFQRIQARYPEASLTLAHDGPSRAELEKYAAALGLRHYRFIGKVPYSRIAALYDEHDIYLTSPDFDCFPGSLLECYSSGLPVVATKAGGIPWIARHEQTALLVDKNDDRAMAEAVFRLLEEPGLSESLARRAYASAQQYLGPRIREQWMAIYRELLGRSQSRVPSSPRTEQVCVE